MPETVDVVVVGAGLAGLCAALHLTAAGLDVRVLEAADEPGGRVRTDRVGGNGTDDAGPGGLLLDRGFQLYNPAYPEAARMLDSDALDLREYDAGVRVALHGRQVRVGDPRRVPWLLPESLVAPVGSPAAKARLALVAARAAMRPARRLAAEPDTSTGLALADRGLGGPLTERVLRPFLAGVFAEDELTTSRRFADLVLRSFVRGTPAVPAAGMGAIPRQLAARLPAGVLRLATPVVAVRGTAAVTDDGTYPARAVVVATDGSTTGALLPGVPEPVWNALTTLYHLAPEPPVRDKLLVVDGLRRGPVVNTSVISNVAPTYAPGRHLVSSTVLGAGDGAVDRATERAVRAHLALLYGADTRRWEHVRSYPIPRALPAARPPLDLRRSVRVDVGRYVAGDHRDTPSIQGAMVSGRRVAAAVREDLGA